MRPVGGWGLDYFWGDGYPKREITDHTNTHNPRPLPPNMLHQQSELGGIKRSIVYGLRGIGVPAAVEIVEEDAVAFGG